jgi:hypothetical protein
MSRPDRDERRQDRAIDRRIGKFHLQGGRHRGHRVGKGAGGHADRAEVIGLGIDWMALPLIAIRRRLGRGQQTALGTPDIQCVDVTEGEGEIDRKRDQREPSPVLDVVPKPAHVRAFAFPGGSMRRDLIRVARCVNSQSARITATISGGVDGKTHICEKDV